MNFNKTIELIQKFVKVFGIQIKKYPSKDLRRRVKILKNNNINKILDVGANIGQYAIEARELGYKGKILSYEPLTSAFHRLEVNSMKDKNWSTHNYALGNKDGSNTINISKNSVSSSLVDMLSQHLTSEPNSIYISKEEIKIARLDTVFESIYEKNDQILLKIDTQGYEKEVIDGALKSLDRIKLIQMEISLVPLYEGQLLFNAACEYLEDLGYSLVSIENGFSDEITGQLLQVDGIFEKR